MLRKGHQLSDDEIRHAYDKLEGIGSIGPEFRRRVIALAGDIKGLAVADIGCGRGELTQELALLGPASVIGVDLSEGRLASLQPPSGVEVRCVTGNLNEAIPLPDQSVDAVFCTEVLEHLKNPDRCLREIRRILRAKGKLILTAPNATAYLPFLWVGEGIPTQWLRGRLLPYEHPCNSKQPIDTCFGYEEIMEMVRRTGWVVEQEYGYRFFRYLEVLPIVRTVYRPFIPWVERCGNRFDQCRFAYNLMLLCRKADT